MTTFSRIIPTAFLLGALLFVPTAVSNSQEAVAPASMTANYGDWSLRCRSVPSNAESRKVNRNNTSADVCEIVHIIRIATRDEATGQTSAPQVLAQIAMGRVPESGDAIKVVFQVPGGVMLREPIRLNLATTAEALADATGDNSQEANYFQCHGNACLADMDLTENRSDAIVSARFARLSFIDGARRAINVPVSLNGFASAFAALEKRG